MSVKTLPEDVAHAERLDPVADRVGTVGSKVTPSPGRLKDLLSGSWLGHPLHPILTDVPVGAWSSAFVLDLLPGARTRAAADSLIGIGVAAAVPTAITGLSDWVDTEGEDRRVGLVHALGNSVALALYATSLVLRRRGRRGAGVLVSSLGMAAATFGAYLGGHLVYNRGIGVDQSLFRTPPDEWTPVVPAASLADGKAHHGMAGDTPVMIVRHGSAVYALASRCTHRGGPLQDGEVRDGAVTCPWHASRFSLEDGSVLQGPATAPQKTFETRISNGMVEVRARPPAR